MSGKDEAVVAVGLLSAAKLLPFGTAGVDAVLAADIIREAYSEQTAELATFRKALSDHVQKTMGKLDKIKTSPT